VGPNLWGEACAGVMQPSADAVGRRYPLIFAGVGEDCPQAPVIIADQGWYGVMEKHLLAAMAQESVSLAGLKLPQVSFQPDGPADFWAVHPSADVAELLSDIAVTDHQRALEGRSYFWQPGDGARHSQVWAGAGLPNGHVLAWFLRGYHENG
jgi:hypothetical protein